MNKFILFILFFSVRVFAQYPINSPFFIKKEAENILMPNSFTAVKPIDFDTVNSNSKNYYLSLSPVFFLTSKISNDTTKLPFLHSRIGFRLNADYKDKLNFDFYYTFGVFKNSELNQFIDTTGILPQVGFYFEEKNQFYYFNDLRFRLLYKTKYINFELGRGKNFLGDGYRSLWLSDFSSPNYYFKSLVQIWRIQYLYLISRLEDKYHLYFSDYQPKYNFTHLLTFNFTKWMSFYMFETVISGAYDEKGLHRGIELTYLNPVLFFRSADLMMGSPDNVLMGLGGKLIFRQNKNYYLLYSQGFIDEFLISHYTAQKGYWDEKFGLQMGIKTLIRNFYFNGEINYVRPYTYSHHSTYLAYGNLYQPLAHPLGANFKEALARLGYVKDKWHIFSKIVVSNFGLDDTLNNGKNIYLSYLSHYKETGNYVGQGINTTLLYFDLRYGRMFFDAVGFEIGLGNRIIRNDYLFENQPFILFSVKMNFWDQDYWDWK